MSNGRPGKAVVAALVVAATAVLPEIGRSQSSQELGPDSLVRVVASADRETSERGFSEAIRFIIAGADADRSALATAGFHALLDPAGLLERDRASKLVHIFLLAGRDGQTPNYSEMLSSLVDESDPERLEMLFILGPEGSPEAGDALAGRLFEHLIDSNPQSFDRARHLAGLLGNYGDSGLTYLDRLSISTRAPAEVRRAAALLLRARGGGSPIF